MNNLNKSQNSVGVASKGQTPSQLQNSMGVASKSQAPSQLQNIMGVASKGQTPSQLQNSMGVASKGQTPSQLQNNMGVASKGQTPSPPLKPPLSKEINSSANHPLSLSSEDRSVMKASPNHQPGTKLDDTEKQGEMLVIIDEVMCRDNWFESPKLSIYLEKQRVGSVLFCHVEC